MRLRELKPSPLDLPYAEALREIGRIRDARITAPTYHQKREKATTNKRLLNKARKLSREETLALIKELQDES